MTSMPLRRVNIRHQKQVCYQFHLKKKAAESYRLLVEAYSEHSLTQKTCKRRFTRFKSGDFRVKDKKCPGQP